MRFLSASRPLASWAETFPWCMGGVKELEAAVSTLRWEGCDRHFRRNPPAQLLFCKGAMDC
jgi:hypothetical protein